MLKTEVSRVGRAHGATIYRCIVWKWRGKIHKATVKYAVMAGGVLPAAESNVWHHETWADAVAAARSGVVCV